MFGGSLSSFSRVALLASVSVLAGSMVASAADLGGNCCADLEERVADLEATTARKGNRKVSLQIYGQISQVLLFWDDGSERNTYVGENAFSKNRLGFRGNAKINADWSAGYKLEFEVKYNETAGMFQRMGGDQGGTTTGAPLSLRHSALYFQHNTFGTVWLGHSSTASSSIADINLASGPNDEIAGVGNNDWFGSFLLRRSGTTGDSNAALSALTWDNVAAKFGSSWNPGGLSRRGVVRYQSPNFLGLTKSSGFNLQTSWGEDDVWDVALRYVEDFGAFRVAAGIAHVWSGDNDQRCSNLSQGLSAPQVAQSAVNCTFLGGSASIMHVQSGIYLTGAAGQVDDKNRDRLFGRNVNNKDEFWYVQAGIEQKWFSLGKTTIYADYTNNSAGQLIANNGSIRTVATTDSLWNANNGGAGAAQVSGTELRQWGVGIVQAIDAAAMNIYLGYINVEADVTLVNANGTSARKSNAIDSYQAIMTGATIKF